MGLAPKWAAIRSQPVGHVVATDSKATVRGIDLGEMGVGPEQAHLRDFSIPQRGMFVVGRTTFTDTAT